MNVVFCGTGWFPIVEYIRRRLPAGVVIRVRDFSRPLAAELRDANVILPSNALLDAEAIAAPSDLRLVQQPAVGVEGIDLEAARARGVPVCNAPGANGEAVAQAALLLILALARKLPLAEQAFARASIGVPIGLELGGKVLGLVGRGQSANALARAAAALGMEVLSVGSTSPPRAFDELLARSDFVSIHCPLTPATRGLFDDAAFARMKPGAYLVNCARGPIVDRGALERALASGRLGGVGLDVHWNEPWDPSDPLYAREDVVALPHIAGSTEEAFGRLGDLVAANIARVARGEPPLYRIA
jgi:phosphoglycerate dehydrogenase-like enzyme